jgi:antitoxin component of MazEF toxin-antitoxin module
MTGSLFFDNNFSSDRGPNHSCDEEMPLRLERKILDVGGSKSVAIPPGWLAAYNLSSGDQVDVLVGSVVIVKPKGVDLDLELVAKELRPMIEARKEDVRRS